MAGVSRISAVFDANTSGFVAGTQRVSAALSSLEGDVAGMRSSLNTLTAISGAQLFGSIVSVTTSAISGLKGMAAAAAESIGAMSKLAERSGAAYSEIAGLQYAGDLAGVGMDAISQALVNADRLFVAAASGSTAASESLAKVGLSLQSLNGMSSAGRFNAIAEALSNMPNSAERTAAAVELFGKSGAGLLPLFKDGAAGLQAMQAEAKKFGLSLTDMQGQNVDAMNDSFTRAAASVNGIVTQVTANLAPGIKNVVDLFTSFIAQADGISLGAQISEGIYSSADFLAGVADGFLAGMSDVWAYVSEVVGGWDGATRLFSRAVQFAQGVFQAFELVGSTMGAGLSAITGLLLSAAADLVALVPGGGEFEKMLRGASDSSYAAMSNYQKQSEDLAKKSFQNLGEAFGIDMGRAASDAAGPAVGGIQAALRAGRQGMLDAANQIDKAGGQAGANAGIQIKKSLEGVKIAAGLDARSSEGYSEFLRLKFGSPSDGDAKRTADGVEDLVAISEDMRDKLNFNVMGMA